MKLRIPLRILLPLSLATTGALWAAIDQEKAADKKPATASKADEPAFAATAEPKPTAEQLDFFEKKIRPVLVEHCYGCHSACVATASGARAMHGFATIAASLS